MANDPKWIEHAHLHKGAFTAKAKGAGMSVGGYARKELAPGSDASSKTKHQAALAETFKRMAR